MERLFLELLNRAICAGWLVPVVLLVRLIFRKAPKWMRCLLWGMVAVRLLLPFSVESLFSMIPSAETVGPEVMYAREPEIHTGIEFLNSAVNPVLSGSFAPKPYESANPLQIITAAASWIWLFGMTLMLMYAAVSYLRLRYHVRMAVPEKRARSVRASGAVLVSERVDSPFVLGLFCPRIYLPVGIAEADREYIISHESAHIRRKDHWIKPVGYLLLSVFWFQPLLWVAYVMLCRDIEYACDERVVKNYDVEERKAYSSALLACSVRRMRIAACPVAFGEVGVKARIRGVLHYKKPAFWILLAAAVCCAVVAVCFLTDPKKGDRTVPDGDAAADGDTVPDGDAAADGEMMPDGDSAADEDAAADGDVAANVDTVPDGDAVADEDTAAGDGETLPTLYGGELVPADGWYEFDRCVYMNALSSYYPFETTGYDYFLDRYGIRLYDEETGEENSAYPGETDDLMNTDTTPWVTVGNEEFRDMFNDIDGAAADLGGLPEEKRLMKRLSEEYLLFYIDGELWFARKSADRRVGMWSIYALRPKTDMLETAVYRAAYDREWGDGSFGQWQWEDDGDSVQCCVSCRILAAEVKTPAATKTLNAAELEQYPLKLYAAGQSDITVTVYAMVLAEGLRCERGGIQNLGGSRIPAAMTFSLEENGTYALLDYWTPRDGSYYVPDIRMKFPAEAADKAIDSQGYAVSQTQECYAQALSSGRIAVFDAAESLFGQMIRDEENLAGNGADAAELIGAYPLVYRELRYYGDYARRYILNEFFRGGQQGVKAELMMNVYLSMDSGQYELYGIRDGQAYFDEWFAGVQKDYDELLQSMDEREAKEFMEQNNHAAAFALSVWETRTADAPAQDG